jgi:ribosome biogenesis GTPase
MSKRKLNLRQRKRITEAQDQFQQNETTETQTGLVICRHGKRAQIETRARQRIDCYIRPNLPTLVAGDNIAWQPMLEQHAGIIVSCYPRATVLERLDKRGLAKPLAANLTQLMIVLAPKPAITWSLIDSYLITAASQNFQACLILNKTDLPSKEERTILDSYYKPLGYPIFYTNQQDPSSYAQLATQLATQTSIFVGQSGVGKSSLIATFLPHLADEIETASLSNDTHGQHTTSNPRYYHLPAGGAIIDSPGVRSFQPAQCSKSMIIDGYIELRPFKGQCQFRNCSHFDTPGCAFTHALAINAISSFRYEQFMKMLKQAT